MQFSIGIDVGGTDATVVTLVGIDSAKAVVVIDGYYHRQGKASIMTHEKYVQEIIEVISNWCNMYEELGFGCDIFCESAEKLFRQSLGEAIKKKGLFGFRLYPSYKKGGILERIRLFCMLIERGKLFAAEHLMPWIEAFYTAQWDEKQREKGNWVRVDDGSYAVDCLDSTEYAVVPLRHKLINNDFNITNIRSEEDGKD